MAHLSDHVNELPNVVSFVCGFTPRRVHDIPDIDQPVVLQKVRWPALRFLSTQAVLSTLLNRDHPLITTLEVKGVRQDLALRMANRCPALHSLRIIYTTQHVIYHSSQFLPSSLKRLSIQGSCSPGSDIYHHRQDVWAALVPINVIGLEYLHLPIPYMPGEPLCISILDLAQGSSSTLTSLSLQAEDGEQFTLIFSQTPNVIRLTLSMPGFPDLWGDFMKVLLPDDDSILPRLEYLNLRILKGSVPKHLAQAQVMGFHGQAIKESTLFQRLESRGDGVAVAKISHLVLHLGLGDDRALVSGLNDGPMKVEVEYQVVGDHRLRRVSML